jgi:hypothetical protein
MWIMSIQNVYMFSWDILYLQIPHYSLSKTQFTSAIY